MKMPVMKQIWGGIRMFGQNAKYNFVAASFIVLSGFATFTAAPALATDVATITDETSPEAGGQFVRMGLNKSIVVKLPAEARDVIVGNPGIVDAIVRKKNVAYLFARGIGQTNAFFFDANGDQILALDIEVAVDPLALQKLIRRTLPGTKIIVETENNNVILTGTAANAGEANTAIDLARHFMALGPVEEAQSPMRVVNAITIAGEDQVMLKVRVVEIQRNVLKRLGIDLQAAINAGGSAFNLGSNPATLFGLANNVSSSLPVDPGLGWKGTIGNDNFGAILKALEEDGMSRTLAEPNLTALTGQEAKFHAGGEFPYVAEFDDKNRPLIKFREFGVNLSFTPTVISKGRINLKLRSEVSEISSLSASGTPALDSRTTQTTLELPSGGSMMIAGLIRETTRQNVNGVPGLKKLPLLGSLFRSRDFQTEETELVVIVTPYLVNSASANQLTTPDKNFNPATERQSLFFGKLNKTYGTNGKAPSGSYNGNVGFIVE